MATIRNYESAVLHGLILQRCNPEAGRVIVLNIGSPGTTYALRVYRHNERFPLEVLSSENGQQWLLRNTILTEIATRTTGFQIVFIRAGEFKLKDPEHVQVETNRRHDGLRESLHMPKEFWAPMQQDASGFFRATEQWNVDNKLETRETWLRLLIKHVARTHSSADKSSDANGIDYVWHRLGIFGRWWPGGRFTVFCFDFPAELTTRIKDELRGTQLPSYLSTPLGVHTWLLELIMPLFDLSVWKCRDIVRDHEKQRPDIIHGAGNRRAEQYYEDLHELARHAVHITEMLSTAANVVEKIILEQKDLEVNPKRAHDKKAVIQTLRYLKSLLEGFVPRAQALQQRLTSETNLLFHLTNQDIAGLAQEDSAAMRTISFLGLVFLPGTFISAIFSMSFFNFDPSNSSPWKMSHRFWVYWAVALPVTLLTILFWKFWDPVKRLRCARLAGHNAQSEPDTAGPLAIIRRVTTYARPKASSDLEQAKTFYEKTR